MNASDLDRDLVSTARKVQEFMDCHALRASSLTVSPGHVEALVWQWDATVSLIMCEWLRVLPVNTLAVKYRSNVPDMQFWPKDKLVVDGVRWDLNHYARDARRPELPFVTWRRDHRGRLTDWGACTSADFIEFFSNGGRRG